MLELINKYKFIPISFIWGLGTVLGYFWDNILFALIFSIISLIIAVILYLRKYYVFTYFTALIFILGISYFYSYYYFHNSFSHIKEINDTKQIKGIVQELELKPISKFQKVVISSEEFITKNKIIKLKRKVVLNIFKPQELKIGNIVVCEGKIKIPENNIVPNGFNKKLYYHSNGLYCDFNVSKLQIIDSNYNWFFQSVYEIRKKLFNFFDNHYNIASSSLMKALFLAYKQDLNKEIKQDFINTGTIHTLAVSGLHVGYVVIILGIIFSFIPFNYRNYFLIIGLILFMLISGIGPSVQRATIMAIIYLISNQLKRDVNLLNILFLAFFIILFIAPYEILNPGFQLSFLAVLSIAMFLPLFDKMNYELKIENPVIKYLLTYLALNISVQILVLPLVVIYFGKISIIGIIANLFVVPLIGLIVSIGFLSIIFSFLPASVIFLITTAGDFFVYILFYINQFLANVKFAFVKINNWGYLNIIVYYFLVILFYNFLQFKKLSLKIYSISILLVIFFLTFNLKLDDKNTNYCVENIKSNKTLISFVKIEKYNILIINGKLQNDLIYELRNLLNSNNIENINYLIFLNVDKESIDEINDLVYQGISVEKIIVPNDRRVSGNKILQIDHLNNIQLNKTNILIKNYNQNLVVNLIHNNKSILWGDIDKNLKIDYIITQNEKNDKIEYERIFLY